MTWRSFAAAGLAACTLGLVSAPAAEESSQQTPAPASVPKIEYFPLDAPEGMAQAVIVQDAALIHTRQLFPLDSAGQLVEGSVDEQIEQVLNNLQTVLQDCGSDLEKLVRLNIYALAPATVDRVRQLLTQRLPPPVRPAITSVLTPLPHRGAVVAVDAVAAGQASSDGVVQKRSEAVAGDDRRADAAILPRGGTAYLSGLPDDGSLTESAVVRVMNRLMRTLEHLQLGPEHVVHLKVFLRPMTSAEEVLREIQKYFPDQMTPPVVFVEWLASVPLEIELIAQLPTSDDAGEALEYFNPPDVWPSHVFSRVALVRTDRKIYISSLYAREPSRGEPQALRVFQQLQEVLKETGSDMRHMVKGTYYVSDHDASRWMDRTRPNLFDPERPPAASKAMIHAVGMEGRTMNIDMIAVERTGR
jgi:enamine deaminase RidA (YjgF/YER057c/UK114 family)